MVRKSATLVVRRGNDHSANQGLSNAYMRHTWCDGLQPMGDLGASGVRGKSLWTACSACVMRTAYCVLRTCALRVCCDLGTYLGSRAFPRQKII